MNIYIYTYIPPYGVWMTGYTWFREETPLRYGSDDM